MFKDETGEIVPAIVSEELRERANAPPDRRYQVEAAHCKSPAFL